MLEVDESNIFAAMGIASVLAEHNKVLEAMEILKGVKEATPAHVTVPNVLINLAHLNVVQGNFEAAINLYKIALEKGPSFDGEIYLAKAYFLSRQFDLCESILKGMILRYASDIRLKFDLANCLYERAQDIFNKEFRLVKETESAIDNLSQSKHLMDFILHASEAASYLPAAASRETLQVAEEQLYYMRKSCEERIDDVKEMIKQSAAYLKFDTDKEQELRDQEDTKLKRVEELQRVHDVERQRREDEERRRKEEEQELFERNAFEAEEKLRQIQEKIYENT